MPGRVIRDLLTAARQMDETMVSAFTAACSFRRLDLALVNPGTVQTMLVDDVTAAGGTAEEWSDGDLTTVRGAQKLRDWIVMKSPRIVWFCCPTENNTPSENDHLTAAQSRSRHQSREHRIQRHISNLASDMASSGQCDFVLEISWNSRVVCFGGCIHERLKGFHCAWVPACAWGLRTGSIGYAEGGWRVVTSMRSVDRYVLIWFRLFHSFSVSLILLLSDPAGIDEEFRKAWLPYFCHSGQRETSLEEFDHEVEGWLPLLPEVSLHRLTHRMLADVVQRKGATAGSLDGWAWRELKVLPVSWYDGLARILTKVEETGVWPGGLLDAYIAIIPKTDGGATHLGQRPLSVLPSVHRIWASTRMGQLGDWFKSWVPDSVFSAGGGRGSVEAWYTSSLDIEEVLAGAADSHVHLFVADVIEFFCAVDRGILDRVLSSLGLPGWFRHAYFEYHDHVRLRFELASGLGEPWTGDGGIPQGCPLGMMFIVALYLPWCRYLSAQVGVQPQLYADNLKCVSTDPDLLLNAARFTPGYVRLVGQEPAPSKCVLLRTSREVRKDMKDWVLSQE